MRITYKNARDLEKMREAGFIVSTVLAALRDAVAPGVTTLELDSLAFDIIQKHGGTPSFLNHRAGDEVYHHSTCISINEEVVHGIPRADRKLREGDLVSLDVGVKFKGFHGDSATTVGVGKISSEAQRLLDVTEESLFVGLRAIKFKGHLQDIGRAIQTYVEAQGFSIVRELSGHGIGKSLWEPPSTFNFVDPESPNPPLLEGMTLAIEPMVNMGSAEIGSLSDGWTVVAVDRKPSAHFEHTVVITRNGCEILTLGPHDPGPWPR